MRVLLVCLAGAVLWGVARPPAVEAQAPGLSAEASTAYTQLLSSHFRVPASEIGILSEGLASLDEVAVVLRLSQLSGIAPAAVAAQRRSGERWMDVARRFGLGAASFHITIPDDAVDDRVARIQRLFAQTPSAGWDAIQLQDDEIVTLTNLVLISRELSVPPGRALEARRDHGSFAEVVAALSQST